MYYPHSQEKQKNNLSVPRYQEIERHGPEPEEELLESPHDFLIPEHSIETILHWQAPEYEEYERDKKWYALIIFSLFTVISWAIYTNSPVMAITFILIGIVGYIHINREPKVMDFMITHDGIVAGKEIYDFDNIKSFWIFYEPEGKRTISFHTKNNLIPYIHIPIYEEDPVRIRKILLDYLPEEKHEEGIAEILERILKI